MSITEGAEFNTSYIVPNETMDHTLHSEHYWDTDRNTDGESYHYERPNDFSLRLDNVSKSIIDLLKQNLTGFQNLLGLLNYTKTITANLLDCISLQINP